MEISMTRLLQNQVQPLSWISRTLDRSPHMKFPQAIASINMPHHSHVSLIQTLFKNRKIERLHSMSLNIEESSFVKPDGDEDTNHINEEDPSDDPLNRPLNAEELKALLIDTEREKLTRKLSEANQQNRFLKRQLFNTEEALANFKGELAVIELEVQALVSLAEEIATGRIPEGTRKINGKYIQSHLASRLGAIRSKLKEQIRDVDASQSKEVPLYWIGMAESVQVMGNFDGWSQGEPLSPEYTDSFTKFSTTLLLRPGRYEIKFLVDGEWQLSSAFPTIGEGMTENNLLIVE